MYYGQTNPFFHIDNNQKLGKIILCYQTTRNKILSYIAVGNNLYIGQSINNCQNYKRMTSEPTNGLSIHSVINGVCKDIHAAKLFVVKIQKQPKGTT